MIDATDEIAVEPSAMVDCNDIVVQGVAAVYEPLVEDISDVSTGVEEILEIVPKEAEVGALDEKEVDLAIGAVVQAANIVVQAAPSTLYAAAATAGIVKRTRASENEMLPKRKDKKQKRGNGLSAF